MRTRDVEPDAAPTPVPFVACSLTQATKITPVPRSVGLLLRCLRRAVPAGNGADEVTVLEYVALLSGQLARHAPAKLLPSREIAHDFCNVALGEAVHSRLRRRRVEQGVAQLCHVHLSIVVVVEGRKRREQLRRRRQLRQRRRNRV